MSSIKLFDINLPLLSVGWRKWFAAQSASGQLAMLRCIVRQSFANRTRKLLKLEVAVEQLHKQNSKRTATHHWRCKKLMMWNGVYAHFCFSVLVGFQGLIPLFRFPQPCFLFSASKQLSDFRKMSHRLPENEPPTSGK